ncbi:MAG: 4-hydroxyphenylpyruvate dioxygenase [Paludibacterium sp.]|uniref:4-hydroxyphenylpyruvate dioxygenase n=1 Tax=Paludibacterium sp. TaxID=1917523 RepID=UPI0025DD4DD6|nr:4-hydroxyphenylpyruvate dioxygenase [Paludibacterium sp.]MBV8047983.1 4-hydroxyphenylpyruvate dioxygenase [Paludibacterium sp.]MBV8649151.1 4-hydroxyphenylpyruvate dioxygenase [Paludibacterium sp.]
MDLINPMATDGFEFVEYTAADAAGVAKLGELFRSLGFAEVARHRHRNVTLFRQGDINFIVNGEPVPPFLDFARAHGPSVCAMAWRVKEAAHAYDYALAHGAKPYAHPVGAMELNIPAIEGIGGSAIYLVDRYGERNIYDVDFALLPGASWQVPGAGLGQIDHLTHNVARGNMDVWAGFYSGIANFREIRYFDIEGKLTGLTSRAMVSPCGKIRIPINQSADDKSQIEEFLRLYHGEGIQHIALSTEDIYATVEALRATGVRFLDTPDTYYARVDDRVPGHGEDLARMRANRILIDGAPTQGGGTLLQIFTETVIGPVFFEIIQRKNNDGFGEGNFKALFESIEEDQVRRGVLTV